MKILPNELFINFIKYLTFEDALYFGMTCKKNYKLYLNNYEKCNLDIKLKNKILMYKNIYIFHTLWYKKGNTNINDFSGHLRCINNKFYNTRYTLLTLYYDMDLDVEEECSYKEGGYFIIESIKNNKYIKYNDNIYIRIKIFLEKIEKKLYVGVNELVENIDKNKKRIIVNEKEKYSEWNIISSINKKGFVVNNDKIILKNNHYNMYLGLIKLTDTKSLRYSIGKYDNETLSSDFYDFAIELENSKNVNYRLIHGFKEISNMYKNMTTIKLENHFYLTNFELCLVDNIESALIFSITYNLN